MREASEVGINGGALVVPSTVDEGAVAATRDLAATSRPPEGNGSGSPGSVGVQHRGGMAGRHDLSAPFRPSGHASDVTIVTIVTIALFTCSTETVNQRSCAVANACLPSVCRQALRGWLDLDLEAFGVPAERRDRHQLPLYIPLYRCTYTRIRWILERRARVGELGPGRRWRGAEGPGHDMI